jgi:lysophospholipase L1-like esterase
MRRALLVLAGLAAALALAEIAVRVLDVPPRPLDPLHVPSYRLSDDPVLRYEYRPGVRAEDAPFDAVHQGFSTNSQGFRDVEFPVEKPAGELRILALGDSTTAGNGVPELENTWPKRLERRFAEAGRKEVRVLNLGVGGYHPLQEARLLELRGLAYEPDLVLMLLCLNDLDASADGGIRGRLERMRARGGDRPDLVTALLRHSRLAFVVAHRARALGLPGMDPEAGVPVRESENPLAEGLALLARLQREHDLRVLVVLLPGLGQPFDRYPHAAIHARMAEIAARTPAVPWLDLLGDFRAAGVNPRQLTVDGLHPNRMGAAVLAEIIYRNLSARGLP